MFPVKMAKGLHNLCAALDLKDTTSSVSAELLSEEVALAEHSSFMAFIIMGIKGYTLGN